jgi:hypothetical protein
MNQRECDWQAECRAAYNQAWQALTEDCLLMLFAVLMEETATADIYYDKNFIYSKLSNQSVQELFC